MSDKPLAEQSTDEMTQDFTCDLRDLRESQAMQRHLDDQDQISRLNDALLVANREIERERARNARLETEVMRRDNALRSQRYQLRDARKGLPAMTQQAIILGEQLAEAQDQLQNAYETIEILTAEVVEVAHDRDTYKDEAERNDARAEDAEVVSGNLTLRNGELEALARARGEDLAAMTARFNETTEMLTVTTAEKATLATELRTVRPALAQANSLLARERTNNTQAARDLTQERGRTHDLTRAMKQVRGEVHDLSSTVKASKGPGIFQSRIHLAAENINPDPPALAATGMGDRLPLLLMAAPEPEPVVLAQEEPAPEPLPLAPADHPAHAVPPDEAALARLVAEEEASEYAARDRESSQSPAAPGKKQALETLAGIFNSTRKRLAGIFHGRSVTPVITAAPADLPVPAEVAAAYKPKVADVVRIVGGKHDGQLAFVQIAPETHKIQISFKDEDRKTTTCFASPLSEHNNMPPPSSAYPPRVYYDDGAPVISAAPFRSILTIRRIALLPRPSFKEGSTTYEQRYMGKIDEFLREAAHESNIHAAQGHGYKNGGAKPAVIRASDPGRLDQHHDGFN